MEKVSQTGRRKAALETKGEEKKIGED